MQTVSQPKAIVKGCKSCGYVLNSDSSETKYRCGIHYYEQAPLVRKQERMDFYPEVATEHICVKWKSKG